MQNAVRAALLANALCRLLGTDRMWLACVHCQDDNTYAEEVLPALRVLISTAAIHFENNEVGFTERNVLALCSIGKSTKQASDPRYIGNKGIGWKSVFKISPRPQVHSRNYHLQFNALDPSGLGYIVPTPAAPPEGWLGDGTTITLNLEQGRASEALRDFRIALDEIKPSLLLFLHQLRRLDVVDEDLGLCRAMARLAHPTDASVLILEESEERVGHATLSRRQEWLVLTRRLDAKVERLGIKTTELAVAFPLVDTSTSSMLPMLEVFAFLPLRSYGMRFLVQADWVVPSSRESVDASSSWNQWLRSCLPELFLQAATTLLARADGEAERVCAANLLLQLVPTDASEFFLPLAKACSELLRRSPCVLTRTGVFVKPGEAVLVGDALQDPAAFATDTLVQQIGLHPLHPDVQMPAKLAQILGVRRFDASLIIELISYLCTQVWGAADDVDHAWLAWALKELKRDASLSRHLAALRKLRMIPLADGGLDCSTPTRPLYRLSGVLLGELLPSDMRLCPFAKLRLVHPALCESVSTDRDAAACLAQLGVQQLTHEEIVAKHLVPALADDGTSPGELPALLALVRRLQPRCRGLTDDAELSRLLVDAGARLLAADGTTEPVGESLPLHVCSALQDLDFLPDPPPPSWRVVSAAYAAGDGGGATKLLPFLRLLGVSDYPNVVEGGDGDWESPELEELLSVLCARRDDVRLAALGAALVSHWSVSMNTAPPLQRFAWRGSADAGACATPTSFLRILASHAWLAGTDGQLHLPHELWAYSPETEVLIGGVGGVAFAVAKLPRDLASALGLRTQLSANMLMELIAKWSELPSFTASLERMAALYGWLGGRAAELSPATTHCIWVPVHPKLPEDRVGGKATGASRPRKLPEGHLTGRFYLPSECALDDASKLIDSMNATVTDEAVEMAAHGSGLRILSRYYSGRSARGALSAFEAWGVQREPGLDSYVGILKHTASLGPPSGASLTCVYRLLCNWAYEDQWTRRAEDEDEDEEVRESDSQSGKSSLRSRLAQALGEAPVFPAALAGTWVALPSLICYTVTRADVTGWSEATLARLIEAKPRDGRVLIKGLEEALPRFFNDVLELPPLSACRRASASALGPASLIPGTRSARVCVASAMLQRWSTKNSSPLQRAMLHDMLQQLQLERASKLLASTELCSADGEVLERTVGTSEVSTMLSGSLLHLTDRITPREMAREVAKLIPLAVIECTPEQLTQAELTMESVLERAWQWEHQPAVPMELLANCEMGGLPILPAGEQWWLMPLADGADVHNGRGAAAVAGDAVDPLMEAAACRERAMLSRATVGADSDMEVEHGELDGGVADAVLEKTMRRLREERKRPGAAPRHMQPAVSLGFSSSAYGEDTSCAELNGLRSNVEAMCGAAEGSCSAEENLGESTCSEGTAHTSSIESQLPGLIAAGFGGARTSGGEGAQRQAWAGTGANVVAANEVHVDAWENQPIITPALITDMGMPGADTITAIGRWGEALVIKALEHSLPRTPVLWENAEGEKGLPWDIVLGDPSTLDGGHFIEVKTTVAEELAAFEMSLSELDCARQKGARYSVYRVLGAGTPGVRVLRLHDPARLLGNGQLTLYVGSKGNR